MLDLFRGGAWYSGRGQNYTGKLLVGGVGLLSSLFRAKVFMLPQPNSQCNKRSQMTESKPNFKNSPQPSNQPISRRA
jgi:hypothetical protein